MSTIALSTDSSTAVINGTIINDFSEGDYVILSPVNPRTSHVNGSGGAVNINSTVNGGVIDVTYNVMKYSDSDAFLNNLSQQSIPAILNGSIKEDYSKDGQEATESYILSNGSFLNSPTNTKNNSDGNALMTYVVRYRDHTRII